MSIDPRIEEPSCLAFSRQDIRAGKASPVIRGLVDIIDSQKRRLDALAAADKAATITTVEELDALPIESVILDCEGYPYRRVRQYPDVPSSWEGYELGEHLDVDTIDFPARVIHWGTE